MSSKDAPGGSCRSRPGGYSKEQPQNSRVARDRQDDMPVAFARIVLGRLASFIYIDCCPLCGLDHAHGRFVHGKGGDPVAAFAWHGGVRAAHCFCQGPGRDARTVRDRWRTFSTHPTEWREPEGQSYRLVLGLDPACFTPRGVRSAAAHNTMIALAARGVATSLQILRPRRPFVLWRGDQ